MEYSAKIKRLEEKLADSGPQKLEADKTYKDQISNLHGEFTNYKTNSTDDLNNLKAKVEEFELGLRRKDEG